jgi:hypothetical protein
MALPISGSSPILQPWLGKRIMKELVSRLGFGLSEVTRLISISPSGVANVLRPFRLSLAKLRRIEVNEKGEERPYRYDPGLRGSTSLIGLEE